MCARAGLWNLSLEAFSKGGGERKDAICIYFILGEEGRKREKDVCEENFLNLGFMKLGDISSTWAKCSAGDDFIISGRNSMKPTYHRSDTSEGLTPRHTIISRKKNFLSENGGGRKLHT